MRLLSAIKAVLGILEIKTGKLHYEHFLLYSQLCAYVDFLHMLKTLINTEYA